MLENARAGFAGLKVDERFKQAALANLERWLRDPLTADQVPLIEALAEAGRWELILDSFYQVIPFGTGGRRGPVGVGPNRINAATISSSIQGHCLYLRRRYPGESLSVVVAYDVRRFMDARGIYPKGVPNPVMGLSSRDFAEMAACVYAANGISVHILPRGSERFISTPELSFSIRHLEAHGGLNVSASHNPPDDNGAKIYNAQGGQEVPPADEELVRIVEEEVREIRTMSWEDAVEAGQIRFLGPDVHQGYIAENLSRSLRKDARSAKVVFTPLHGTGDGTVAEVLAAAGFAVELEPTQSTHDGAFPNVPFSAPNPEVPQSMDRAVALAEAKGFDLVMACDPDADRLGVVVKTNDGWRFLTGNEIGALVVRHALVHRPRSGRAPIVMKTEVTSSLVSRVARVHGAQVVGHLLVGFKYIADGLRQLETNGSFYNAEGKTTDFAAGIEESHGALVTPNLRDKDAAGAALYLAEAASLEKAQGRTLVDTLEDCWKEAGYVANHLISTVMRGATGRTRIEAIQASFRKDPPRMVGQRRVTAVHDRLDPKGPFGRVRSGTDAASRDVMVFELGEDARIILRPSGTEPKNKVYVELAGPLERRAEVEAACRQLAEDFAGLMLRGAGIDLPPWAIRVSDLVAVEQKQHFAAELMPALLARIDAGEGVDAWLDEQLRPYGKDGRSLVRPAVHAYVQSLGAPNGLWTRAEHWQREQLLALFP